jgi:sulfite exporter TauE/SafE/copper chaperone CopZ
MTSSKQTYTFHVQGMHCTACTVLTESELAEHPRVFSAHSSLQSHTVTIQGDFGDQSPENIAKELSGLLAKHDYRLSVEKQEQSKNWSEFKIALPLALVFGGGFVLLQKAGLVDLIHASSVSFGTAFLVGIVASLSTCMAVVGGLVLSLSATFAKQGDRIRPQIYFHMSRIISFFVLGGLIGAIGASFTLSTTGIFIMSLLIGVVMFILGINLLDVFPWAKKLQPSLPKFFSRNAREISKFNHTFTPLFVGMMTFFLPCGFTQSMQLYTLSTGSFLSGGLTMLSFALGTLPVLALLSFSSFSIQRSAKSGIFFKTAGLVVIMFAVFNLINSLVVIGLISPLFNL